MQPIPHDRFPKRVQTVSEFAKNKGLTEEYVRQCCRQQVDGNGNYAKLPKGYLSKKEGRTWKIYYTGADLSALEKSKFDYLVALDEVLETWQRLDQELLHSDESSEEYLDLRVKLGKATSKLTKDQYAQVLNQLMTLSRLCSTLSVWKRNRLSNSCLSGYLRIA